MNTQQQGEPVALKAKSLRLHPFVYHHPHKLTERALFVGQVTKAAILCAVVIKTQQQGEPVALEAILLRLNPFKTCLHPSAYSEIPFQPFVLKQKTTWASIVSNRLGKSY